MMLLSLPNWLGTSLASLLLLEASRQQASGIPWWVYLVVLSVLLLILFVVVVALAWRDTDRPNGES